MPDSTAFRFDDKMNFDFHAPRRVRVELHSALNEIEQAELVRRLVEQELSYQFKHALVQESTYSTLMKQQRKQLHQLVAEALERMYPERLDELAARLAQHYSQADEYDKTFQFAARAAESERSKSAYPEARLHYTLALDAIAHLTDSVLNRRRRIDLALRALDLRWAGDTAAQDLELLDDLEETAHGLAPADEIAYEDRIRLVRIHLYRGSVYFAINQMERAMQTFDQVLVEAQALGEPELVASPSLMIGAGLAAQGFFSKALPLLTQAWDIFKEHTWGWEWVCLVHLTTALANLGRLDEAHALVELAAMGLDENSSLRAHNFVSFSFVNIALQERDMPSLVEYSRQAVQASRIGDDPLYLLIGLSMLALGEAHIGEGAAAQAHMQESQQLLQKLGGQTFFSDRAGAAFAQTALELGDADSAIALASEAITIAKSYHGISAEGWAERVWGQALAMQNQLDAAVEHLARSSQLFDLGDARLEAARTRVAWEKILRERGDIHVAREQLEQAAAQFGQSGLTRELNETRALLNEDAA